MSSEKNKTLKLNQQRKSEKMPYAIYADIKCLVKKIDSCDNNPKISSTTKIGEHIQCGYLLSSIRGFDHIEKKHSLYRRKDCMKEFCKSLEEHAMKIINFEKKKIFSLTTKKLKSFKEADKCYICEIRFFKRLLAP